MNAVRRLLAIAAVLSALLASGTARAALVLPDQPEGRVSDYAHALDPAARQGLEAEMAEATSGRTLQYAIAIFPSLEGETIEDVSIRLADKWKIGGKKDSDGVLLTVFLADRKLRIEVGYGLEGQLTDVQASRIIREVMAPRLRAGDLAGGLHDGLVAINEAVGGHPIGAGRFVPSTRPRPRGDDLGSLLVIGVPLLVAFVVLALLVLAARRSSRGWSGGSSGWTGYSGGSSWSSGGSGWSSSDSSSSSSDFSGGGGSFGGGGASGDW